jgi:hypothetical protein
MSYLARFYFLEIIPFYHYKNGNFTDTEKEGCLAKKSSKNYTL